MAREFHENRRRVIRAQSVAYDQISETINSAREKLESEVRGHLRRGRHARIDRESILAGIVVACEKAAAEVASLKAGHPNLLEQDPVLEVVTSLFDGRVGEGYTLEEMERVYADGERRYRHKVGPGFADRTKEPGERYGDLVLWYQVIDEATERRGGVILVTGDVKEDWYWREDGKTLGPRPELVQEMWDKTGTVFYLYPPDPFMEWAGRELGAKVEEDAVEEVREVREVRERNVVELKVLAKKVSAWSNAMREGAVVSGVQQLADRAAVIPGTPNSALWLEDVVGVTHPSVLDAMEFREAVGVKELADYQLWLAHQVDSGGSVDAGSSEGVDGSMAGEDGKKEGDGEDCQEEE